MRQKSVNESDRAKRAIIEKYWERRRDILESLASRKYQLKQVAALYDCETRTIERIRARAIEEFRFIKKGLSKSARDYLRSWAKEHDKQIAEKSPRETKEEKFDQHKEDLCRAAGKVYAELCECHAWPADMTIEEINLERNDPKLIGLFGEKIVIGLLAHLQADIEELKRFARWEDLTPNDISKDLLDTISMKAVKREFNAKCDICKDW